MGFLFSSKSMNIQSTKVESNLWLTKCEYKFETYKNTPHLYFDSLDKAPDALFFDMDKTLLKIETLDLIAERSSIDISPITEAAMVGTLSFDEALRRRLILLEGCLIDHFIGLAATLPLSEGARSLANLNIPRFIISGGCDIIAKALCQQLGFDGWMANTFCFENNVLVARLPNPLIDGPAKAKWVESKSKELGFQSICVVGDGANDIDMLQLAQHPFGFEPKVALYPYLRGTLNDFSLLANVLNSLKVETLV
jgi:phosphoserine phosphatase